MTAPIYIHGALEKLTEFYQASGIALGDVRKVGRPSERSKLAGAIVLVPAVGQIQDLWSRRFPDPVTAFASGWMRVRARARQRGVELPLVVSDHSDWDDLCRTILDTGAGEVWVTHGQEDALVHWCVTQGIRAKPLHLVGYGDEGEVEPGEPGAAVEPAAAEAEPRREPLRRTPRPPRLRARPQRQAAADDGLFPHHAGPGARLRAGGDGGRADLRQRQARPDPRADHGAHGSCAVRPLLRLSSATSPKQSRCSGPPSRARTQRPASPRWWRRCRRATAQTCRACSRAGSTRWTRPAAGRC